MGLSIDLSRTVRMTVEGRLFGQQIINIFHYHAPTDVTFDADSLLVAWRNEVMPDMLACVSNNYSIIKLSYRTLLNPVAQGELVVTASNTGQLGDGAMPTTVAGIISWRTGFAGRSRRGRTYLAGIPEDRINASLVTAQEIGNITTFAANAIQVASGTSGWQLQVVSDPSGQLPALGPYASPVPARADVTSFLVREVPGTQRRRRIGVGS